MLSNVLDRISFWSLFAVIVLLPLFFIPFFKIPIETSKGLLLVVGLAVSIIFWIAARFSDGKVSVPKSALLGTGLLVTMAFLLSSIFSPASQVSFFGSMMDTGTFFFILAAFLLMLFSSIVLKEPKNARIVFWGFILSSLVTLLFQAAHIFFPQSLSLGVLPVDKTANLFGTWNSLGIFAGLSVVMSLYVVEFLSVSKLAKWLLGALVVISLFLSAAVGLSLIWVLLGIFALIIFIYKVSLSYGERKMQGENTAEAKKMRFPLFSFVIVMLSLLFFMSGQFIGSYIPNLLGIANIEVNPSFSATMSVTGQELAKSPIFGAGPNRFGEVWAMYKPVSINSTIFWDTTFTSGSGLLPTFAATTGGLGILAWLLFLYVFVTSGFKLLFDSIRNNDKKEASVFFVLSLYLFVSSFFYSVGMAPFLLAFAFSGIFTGMAGGRDPKKELTMTFLDDPRKSFFSISAMVLLMLITAASGFKYLERFISVPYFSDALTATSLPQAESSITRAVALHANDLYLRTYAQVYLSKIASLVSKNASSLSDADKAALQSSFDQAVGGAQLAVQYDSMNYLNYASLGNVYDSVGVLGVKGAYDKALESYQKAAGLNPLNPALQLDLARVSFANKDASAAEKYAKEALKLKPDYVDALLTLSQIEKNSGNISSALTHAEQALSLDPTNKNISDYVNSLKNVSIPNPKTPSAKPAISGKSGQ